MKRLFVLTPNVKNDLKEIFLDIAENSLDRAESLRREFYEGLQFLGRSPGIGHYHDELLNKIWRTVSPSRWIIKNNKGVSERRVAESNCNPAKDSPIKLTELKILLSRLAVRGLPAEAQSPSRSWRAQRGLLLRCHEN